MPEAKEPLTRRDLVVAVAVLGGIAAFIIFLGSWFFYMRTEGIRLEERYNAGKELDAEVVKRVNQLAEAVNAVQLQGARLLELYMKALDEKRKE